MPPTRALTVFRIKNVASVITTTHLEHILHENLSSDEGQVAVNVTFIPSCYGNRDQHDSTKWALVDFHPKVPRFLKDIADDKTESQRLFLEVEDRSLIIDVNFYGFTQLYEVKGKKITADIVAVTGLGGHAYGSWRGKQTKKMWLRDFLAQDFPNCRTMIYGYNSNLRSRGIHTLKDYKLEFLKEIAKIRSSEEALEAATRKSEKNSLAGNQDLVASTCLVMFFGTPHRGISMRDVRKMLEDDNHNPRISLLEEIENELNLEPDRNDFVKLASAEGFKIVSFYERLQTAEVAKTTANTYLRSGDFKSTLDTNSALLHLAKQIEEAIPVNSDHTNMVKFDHKQDTTYEDVVQRLRKYLDTAEDHATERFRALNINARSITSMFSSPVVAYMSPPYRTHTAPSSINSAYTWNILTSPFQKVNASFNYVRSIYPGKKERMINDRRTRDKIRRRFKQNQEDCTFTVLALMPTAAEQILEEFPVEKLIQELQKKDSSILRRVARNSTEAGSEVSAAITTGTSKDDNTQSLRPFASENFVIAIEKERTRKSKAQLWDEIKISSITRSFTLLYTLALLTILIRVQLNLLGRKNYLSSVISHTERDDEPTFHIENRDDDEINREYLTFSWWLLHRGWRDIVAKVDLAVKQVFEPLTPRDTISFTKLRKLMEEVRKNVEGRDGERKNWLRYLLPPRDQEHAVLAIAGKTIGGDEKLTPSPALRRLLDETTDFINGPGASEVVRKMLNAGFEFLLGTRLADQAFKANPSPPASITMSKSFENSEHDEQPEEMTTKFAAVLAEFSKQADAIGNRHLNSYLQVMEDQKEVEAFSALVFSSNFEYITQHDLEQAT
ncbi:peroxin [Rhizina undulata]